MDAKDRALLAPGPFRAENLHPGDPYELSNGHAILCLPTGSRGARANLVGGAVLESDPDVVEAGIDAGFSPEPSVLRAPDIAVGGVPDRPGWAPGAPALAVEYSDTGQREDELEERITDLFTMGTKIVWVVRLIGPRRVEVREPGAAVRVVTRGQTLHAPGILRNPVPVEALYDASAAHEATLRNLLQRKGYDGLDSVRVEGARRSLGRVLARRGFVVSGDAQARIDDCADLAVLERWLDMAVTAESLDEVFVLDGSTQ